MHLLFDQLSNASTPIEPRGSCNALCSDYCTSWCVSENTNDNGMISPPIPCSPCTTMCFFNCDAECVMYCDSLVSFFFGEGG